jgi:glycosyltransferase involved in cell wall biosynthesis
MQKKIIIAANTAWSVYKFRSGLILSLIESGYDVIVAAPVDPYVDCLCDLGCRHIPLSIDCQGINPIADLRLLINMVGLLRSETPDIIINYTIKVNIYGSIAAYIAKIPSICVTTGLGYTFIQNSWVSVVARLLLRLAYRFPYQVWFLNQDDYDVFVNKSLVQSDRAVIIPGEGVDTTYYSCHFINHKPIVRQRVLLIARIMWDKGVGEFVDAALKLRDTFPEVEFSLLGPVESDNPSAIPRSKLDHWVSEGIISYLGVSDDVRSYISSSLCVVLPSYREGIPRTLLEAAAMCKPIVATNVPGCRDVVEDGVTGYLCKPYDFNDLSSKLECILRMSETDRKAMGNRGRKMVESKFDQKLVINHYIATLSTLNI